MKLYLPNTSKQSIGGGWTFRNNLQACGAFEFVDSWKACDVVLITGATMTDRKEMQNAKDAGKPIVFRVDNIPKDSRNRGTAFSRMIDFARMADHIVFQSNWAKEYAGWWFEQNGIDVNAKSSVVYNGVDYSVFYPQEGLQHPKRYLYVQFNRDENKRAPEAFYEFHKVYRKDKDVELWIVGQFSPELVEYNFDFFAGEKVTYFGIVEDRMQLADIMRQCRYILFPAYCDASPNTLLEALACGCKPEALNIEGGSLEQLALFNRSIIEMGEDYKKVFNTLV